MKSQHQVILSIGSNQGNRLENVRQCIELIHREVGTVVKVSKYMKLHLGDLKVMHSIIVPLFCILSVPQIKFLLKF